MNFYTKFSCTLESGGQMVNLFLQSQYSVFSTMSNDQCSTCLWDFGQRSNCKILESRALFANKKYSELIAYANNKIRST